MDASSRYGGVLGRLVITCAGRSEPSPWRSGGQCRRWLCRLCCCSLSLHHYRRTRVQQEGGTAAAAAAGGDELVFIKILLQSVVSNSLKFAKKYLLLSSHPYLSSVGLVPPAGIKPNLVNNNRSRPLLPDRPVRPVGARQPLNWNVRPNSPEGRTSYAGATGIERNETKRNETKRNETKRNETKRNETKRNETKRNWR